MKRWLQELARGKTGARDLNFEEANAAAAELLDGGASEAQAGAFLTALRLKSETPDELAAFILALRLRSSRTELDAEWKERAVVVAGGSEGRDSFNASLGASLLCTLAGMKMLLQSCEPLPPLQGVGLGALLRSLGVQRGPADEPLMAMDDLQHLGLGYLDSETWCPVLADLRRLRGELGVRTVLHSAERFLKPLGCKQLLVGVQNAPALERVRTLAGRLGAERVVAVQGLDGSEDLPIHRAAQVVLIENGQARTLTLDAGDLGLQGGLKRGLSLDEQRGRLAQVLGGEASHLVDNERKQVLWNTACRLWFFGQALSLGEGLEQAQELLRSGRGLTLLMKWARLSESVAARAQGVE
jgi:anthranilate phosphoribosyltransferase